MSNKTSEFMTPLRLRFFIKDKADFYHDARSFLIKVYHQTIEIHSFKILDEKNN